MEAIVQRWYITMPISKTNLSIAILSEAGNLISITLDTNIIPESKGSHTVTTVIFKAVEMKGIFLTRWI